MPDYSKDIEAAKQKAIDELNSHIDEMSDSAYDIMLKQIEETFDIKAGKIVGDKDFIKKLNLLTVDVLELLQTTPSFSGPVSQFVKRMPTISTAIDAFQKNINNIIVPDFEIAKNIVIDETLNQMLDNGLNQHFVQPLRDLIYQNVTSGLSLTDARAAIWEYIAGGKDVSGKLGRYLDQTAIQSVSAYSGAINKKILETTPEMNGLLMIGSLIDNSSPQCVFVREELNSRITRENWPQVEAIAKKHGLIEGTTFDNLPVNLLHWGCRHDFDPLIIKSLQKET